MARLTIYLDEDTARRLTEAADREGVSRSAWVKRAVQSRLENRLPDSFFQVLGTWEDDRKPEQILRDLRSGSLPGKNPDRGRDVE